MDVLYRVRRARDNEMLRYSLRSLANVEHGSVFVVGDAPAWANVDVLPPDRWQSKWRGLVADTWSACVRLAGRTLLLMDDDYFILRPCKAVEPVHNGPLAEHAIRKMGAYRNSLKATVRYLEQHGIADPLSYELHLPMVVEADRMAALLEPVVEMRYPLQARSLYGNLAGLGGKQASDVKRYIAGPLPRDYLSVSHASWRHYRHALAKLFPTPSVYES